MLPKLITSLLGSRARAIIERDGQVISPSSTRSYPLVAERGEGAIVEDPGGNRFPGLRRGIAVVAEKLAGLVDKGSPRRVYLGNSGTEAVEAPSSWLGTSSGGGSSWRSWVPFTVESWVTGADREQERPEEGLSPLDFAAQTIEECLGLLN